MIIISCPAVGKPTFSAEHHISHNDKLGTFTGTLLCDYCVYLLFSVAGKYCLQSSKTV